MERHRGPETPQVRGAGLAHRVAGHLRAPARARHGVPVGRGRAPLRAPRRENEQTRQPERGQADSANGPGRDQPWLRARSDLERLEARAGGERDELFPQRLAE